MRFYQGSRAAVLWNPETKKPAVEFKRGVFETEDKDLIKLLKDEGYLTQQEKDKLVALGITPHGGFVPAGPTVEGAATAAPAVPVVEDVVITEDEETPPATLKRPRKQPDKPKRALKRKK